MLTLQESTATSRPAPVRDALTPGIEKLVRAIEEACQERPDVMAERTVAALKVAAAVPDLLTPAQRQVSTERYSRHVLYSDPRGRFTILSLVWGPGQFSPTHAHYTWCAYAVHEGTLSETGYDFDPSTQKARPLGLAAKPKGDGCFSHAGLDQIHRLGNAGSDPAISIHVYGIEGERVGSHVNRVLDVARQQGTGL